MAVFSPPSMAKEFGVEYNESLFKLIFHFGLLLMIFSAFFILAAILTFKGKREGIQLGIVCGWGMLLAFVLDLMFVRQGMEISLLTMGVLTTLTAHLALKGTRGLENFGIARSLSPPD